MSSRIKSVKIEGLWGVKTITTTFFQDVNIFIGNNGTSKTTFLNLIESVLRVDLNILTNICFKKIIIYIEDKLKITTISVEKNGQEEPIIIYDISGKKFEIPNVDIITRRGYRYSPNLREEYFRLKQLLNELMNISWISVHRESLSQDEFYSGREHNKNTVDERLNELMKNLTVYQLQLELEASRISDKFKENVFTLMLFNPKFDKVDTNKFKLFDSSQIKKDLFTTYKELGVSINKEKSEIIQNHVSTLLTAIKKVKNNEQLVINDLFPLSLVNRTLSLIEISKDSENKKQDIFKPINLYLESLKKFMPDKEFKLDKESSGQLEIKLKSNFKEAIPLSLFSLSSGEKQLVILLTETLLQKQESYLFMADEPELSLHISWQRKIIESLRELNPNAQIVLATHSPEIAGKWPKNIINMENISSYEEN